MRLFCIPLSLHYHWLPPKLLPLGKRKEKLVFLLLFRSLNRNFAPRKETLYKIGTKNEYIGIYFCRETAES